MTRPAPQLPPDDPLASAPERAGSPPVAKMTFAQFLAFADAASDQGYEYVGGYVYALNTGTDAHAAIATNLTAILRPAARGARCRIYANNMSVLTPSEATYVPDVMVECGPRPPGGTLYREHPCLLVEVLSPSTRDVDLGEKLANYREIETLQAYWIVEATWRCVYRHWRDAAGAWQSEEVRGDGVLPVPCPVEMTLTLDDVYEDVDVPREPPPPSAHETPEPPRPRLRRVHEPDTEYAVADDADAVPAR